MTDSLDDLLSSCSLASRSIRLLTAETKRRAVLLRACCSEYERALERLSTCAVRLDARREEDAQHEHDYDHNNDHEVELAEPTVRGSVPSASPDPGPAWCREAGQGRLSARYMTSAAAAAAAAVSVSFQGSSAEVATSPKAVTEVGIVPVDLYASEESSRITKSLEEILEQARRIRTSNSPNQVGTAVGAGAGAGTGTVAALPPRERATTATATAAQRAASASSSNSTVGGRAKSVASSSFSIGRGGRGVRRAPPGGRLGKPNTNATAIPHAAHAATGTPRVHSGAKTTGAAPVSCASRRHKTRTSSSGAGAGSLDPRHRAGVRNTRSAGKVSQSTAPTSGHAGGSISGGSRVEAHRAGFSSSECNATPAWKQEQEKEVAESEATATEVASNLESGMWEEVARYEAARRSFVGRNGSSSSGCSSVGDRAAKSSRLRQDFEASEEGLLRGLDSDNSGGFWRGCPQGQRCAHPDPRFLEWRELLLSHSQRASARDLRGRDHGHVGADSAGCVDTRCREEDENPMDMDMDRLEEVTRLQRSLLMLLDELEGRRLRRELLVYEDHSRSMKRKVATQGGSDWRLAERDGGGEGQGGGGMGQALREFEDWYCWNKVAHVTALIRERLDVMAHDSCTGGGSRALLSEDTRKLLEDPSVALVGNNPLRSLSDSHDDAGWRSTWQQSSGVHDLLGTACLGVVRDMQTSAPSCWPHAIDSARGHTAELFAHQLRTTSILAAETDISRLVIPTLARELSRASQASLQRPPPEEAQRSAINTNVQQQVQHTVEGVAHTRMSGRGGELECLRERVRAPKGLVSAGKRAACGVGDDCRREAELWAPALAVFRAVDAVLNGGGRSRISFVHLGGVAR